jgi:hypothetical protein
MTMRVYHEQQKTARITQAQQQVTALSTELTTLYARFYHVSLGERERIIQRIVDIRAALAEANDEYRRARCGAPRKERPYAIDVKRQHGGVRNNGRKR